MRTATVDVVRVGAGRAARDRVVRRVVVAVRRNVRQMGRARRTQGGSGARSFVAGSDATGTANGLVVSVEKTGATLAACAGCRLGRSVLVVGTIVVEVGNGVARQNGIRARRGGRRVAVLRRDNEIAGSVGARLQAVGIRDGLEVRRLLGVAGLDGVSCRVGGRSGSDGC